MVLDTTVPVASCSITQMAGKPIVYTTMDVMSDKQTREKYLMIDSVEGVTDVESNQKGHISVVSCHYHIRQNTSNDCF